MDTQHNPPTAAVVRRKGKDLQTGDVVYLPNQAEPVKLGALIYVHSTQLNMFQIGDQGKLSVRTFEWYWVQTSR